MLTDGIFNNNLLYLFLLTSVNSTQTYDGIDPKIQIRSMQYIVLRLPKCHVLFRGWQMVMYLFWMIENKNKNSIAQIISIIRTIRLSILSWINILENWIRANFFQKWHNTQGSFFIERILQSWINDYFINAATKCIIVNLLFHPRWSRVPKNI